MKKTISLALAGILGAAAMSFGLAACDNNKYDLSYGTWNLGTEAGNNIERQMIKAFEEKYDVKIRIEDSIAVGAYESSLDSLAAKNRLPDVYMLPNMTYGLESRWIADISDLVAADETGDWNDIPKPIEEAVHYKSGIYAIPFAMHMMGYFVNVDLLEEYNLDSFLENEITMASFENVLTTLKAQKSKKIVGLNKEDTILEWYPSSVNSDLGWYTWDGEKYNLDGSEFSDAMTITKRFYEQGYTYNGLTEEDFEGVFAGVEGSVELWNEGGIAFRWGASYEVPNMLEAGSMRKIKFIGVPGGRTPMVGDYLAISKTCENKDLAYKFAKWMSFDPAGIRERIARDTDVTNTMPLTTDAELVKEYFDKFDAVDGLQEAFATLDNGIVEAVKVIPGYGRSRWTALTGLTLTVDGTTVSSANLGQLIDWCWNGKLTYADYAKSVNDKANQWYASTVQTFEQYYN